MIFLILCLRLCSPCSQFGGEVAYRLEVLAGHDDTWSVQTGDEALEVVLHLNQSSTPLPLGLRVTVQFLQ